MNLKLKENIMESIPKNVILDLLPAYLAGEASKESRALVEEYAKNDPGLAKLIRAGNLEPDLISQEMDMPENLEKKTVNKVRKSIRRQMFFVALATAFILLIPLVAMQFTGEVNWGWLDFLVMGILLSGTGIIYVFISGMSDSAAYKSAIGIAVLTIFLLIWINLAVGIIGSEGNPANLLYLGVLVVGIIGAVVSRLRSKGMSITMFAAALVQFVVPIIALIIWTNSLQESPGMVGVFIINTFFTMLLVLSAFLFRRSIRK